MSHALQTLLGGVWQSLAGVAPLALGIAVVFHLAKLVAEARAWHWIVSHAHVRQSVRFRTTLGAFVGSIGANAFLPARVGETFRVGVVRRHVPDSSVLTIAATIVLETVLEVAFAIAAISVVLLTGRSLGSGGVAPVARLTASPVALTLAVALVLLLAGLVVAFRRRALVFTARMAQGFAIVQSPRAFVVQVVLWKLAGWSLRLGSVYAFLAAFHLPAAPWTAVVVVAAQSVAASVPLLPGNAGTQQAAIGIALAGSASAAAVLGFGVGMQAATSLADLLVGAAALVLVAEGGGLRGVFEALRLRRPPAPA